MTCAGASNALISQPGSEYYTFELTRLLLIQSLVPCLVPYSQMH